MRWEGPGLVRSGCRCWCWEDPEQPVLSRKKTLNLPNPALSWSKLLWPVITLCTLLMPHFPLRNPLRKAFRYSFLCLPSALRLVQMVMGLYPSGIINCGGLGPGWVNLSVPSSPPRFPSTGTLSVAWVPLTWSCAPWCHAFRDKDGYLSENQPVA